MTKQEFIQNYVNPEQQRLAQVLLTDQPRDLQAWQMAWKRMLNQTAQ